MAGGPLHFTSIWEGALGDPGETAVSSPVTPLQSYRNRKSAPGRHGRVPGLWHLGIHRQNGGVDHRQIGDTEDGENGSDNGPDESQRFGALLQAH